MTDTYLAGSRCTGWHEQLIDLRTWAPALGYALRSGNKRDVCQSLYDLGRVVSIRAHKAPAIKPDIDAVRGVYPNLLRAIDSNDLYGTRSTAAREGIAQTLPPSALDMQLQSTPFVPPRYFSKGPDTMTKNKKPVSRAANSTSQTVRIRFSQIKTDKEHDYCHRGSDALKPDNLAGLADNLVSEGQQTPFTVYDSGQTDASGDTQYVLIGGFRRFHALQKAISETLDTARIYGDMEVEAVEVVQGEEQHHEEFCKDILIRSIAENEQRKNFTTEEKLEIVKQLKAAKVPDPRAASSLAISETQYRRFVSVTDEPWLHQHVTDNCIGMTDAAELIQMAKKKDRVAEFKEDLNRWIEEHRKLIETEREELAKVGKKLSGSAAHVKKYATTKLVKHWITCIDNHRRFDDNVGFRFGILVNTEKGTITIPSAHLKFNELSSADFETIIGELEDTVDRFLPIMRERRLVEEVTQMSDEDKEKERERIRVVRRRRQAKAAKANAGRPAVDFDQTAEPDEISISTDDEEDTESDAMTIDEDDVEDNVESDVTGPEDEE